jgi:hypothetical protein
MPWRAVSADSDGRRLSPCLPMLSFVTISNVPLRKYLSNQASFGQHGLERNMEAGQISKFKIVDLKVAAPHGPEHLLL